MAIKELLDDFFIGLPGRPTLDDDGRAPGTMQGRLAAGFVGCITASSTVAAASTGVVVTLRLCIALAGRPTHGEDGSACDGVKWELAAEWFGCVAKSEANGTENTGAAVTLRLCGALAGRPTLDDDGSVCDKLKERLAVESVDCSTRSAAITAARTI
mmetsp:Transcript_37259/g.93506  ORF Transcript_37259/g.93506 Transcript_37259/m.93506 type:complete len:157 (-) Transcript_37259:64-534(-)